MAEDDKGPITKALDEAKKRVVNEGDSPMADMADLVRQRVQELKKRQAEQFRKKGVVDKIELDDL